MLAIQIKFTTGRYYARSWSDSGAEWPPSPYRILRAVIAAWKYNLSEISEDIVRSIIQLLSSERPLFVLPTTHVCVEGEPRKNKAEQYVSINSQRCVYVIWPSVCPSPQQKSILKKIVGHIHYLGRTKSWCTIDLARRISRDPNCTPADIKTDVNCVKDVLLPSSNVDLDDLYTVSREMRKSEPILPTGSKYVKYHIKMDRKYRSR